MTTVADIAKDAFDAVSGAITDAILGATLSDGSTDYTGRVVLGGETAPKGVPMATMGGKERPAYLEGFGVTPAPGWTITAGGVTYYATGVRDIVEAGGFIVVNVIAREDLLWQTATFQRRTRTMDGGGGWTETWADIGSAVSVGIVAVSGEERRQNERQEALATHRVITAPVSGLSADDRLVIESRPYAIQRVDDVENRGVWMVLDVREGMAA